jgi:hypothetical protein
MKHFPLIVQLCFRKSHVQTACEEFTSISSKTQTIKQSMGTMQRGLLSLYGANFSHFFKEFYGNKFRLGDEWERETSIAPWRVRKHKRRLKSEEFFLNVCEDELKTIDSIDFHFYSSLAVALRLPRKRRIRYRARLIFFAYFSILHSLMGGKYFLPSVESIKVIQYL